MCIVRESLKFYFIDGYPRRNESIAVVFRANFEVNLKIAQVYKPLLTFRESFICESQDCR